MKIILDAMGGDNAPDANIKGAVNAINKVKAEVILVGKEEVIRNRVKEIYGKEIEEISDRLKIQNAAEPIIEVKEEPQIKKDIMVSENPKINVDKDSKVIADNVISDDEFFDDFFGED